MSLQGEDSPKAGERADGAAQDGEQLVYRYDWSFGIALMKGYYWDWMNCFPAKGALAIHLLLQPDPQDPGPEPVPVGAFLSAMRPSRNTKGWAEQALPAVMKGLADMARIGAHTLPMLDYAASGLTLGSTVLESSTGDRKNWFLYQFLDEELKCPAVEFRIYKEVLMEYGSLLRGTVFLAFPRSVKPNGGKVRIQLRPQLHYCDGDELCFIVPTDQIEPENPIYIDVEPR